MALTSSDEVSEDFLRSSDPKKSCVCSRTWILVVHNDFLQVAGYERRGNDVDLQNLRRVFETERHCKFAQLANCSKAQIIETLSSKQKLVQLFNSSKFSIISSTFLILVIQLGRMKTRNYSTFSVCHMGRVEEESSPTTLKLSLPRKNTVSFFRWKLTALATSGIVWLTFNS